MSCSCCGVADAHEVFKPRRKRWCTDIACLVLFVAALVYFGGFFVVTFLKDPTLLDDIIYPKDLYGNYCGKPGSATADYPKAVFPTLDADILIPENLAYLSTGQYWNFRPTVYCTQQCPEGFSLKAPVAYGGASYPGAQQPPVIYYAYQTQDVLSRCFPLDTTTTYERLQLCATPACTNATLISQLSGSVSCYNVESQPEADNVWQMCGEGVSSSLCTQQQDACELAIDVADTQTFVPVEQTTESEAFTKQYASYVKTAMGAVESIIVGPGLVTFLVGGFAAPLLLGFVWALFLRLFAAPLVYTLVTFYVLLCIGGSCYLAIKAGWLDSSDEITSALASLSDAVSAAGVSSNITDSLLSSAEAEEKTLFSVLAVIAIIFTVLSIVGLIACRKAIKRLVAMIREMTKIFKDMFLIQLFPLLSLLLQLGLFVFFLLALYFVGFVWEDQEWYIYAGLLFSYIFGFLWCVQTVRAIFWTSMSAAIAWWYCNRNAPSNKSASRCCPGSGAPLLLSSLFTVLSKHVGSAAFGAGIIAIVQVLQIVMHALNSVTKKRQADSNFLKYVMKCALCCLHCLEKTIKFISYFAFVYVAVRGSSFCRAASQTFGLIAANPGQVAINKMVQKLLGLLIGLSTPIGCCLAAFFFLESQTEYAAQYEPIYCAIAVLVVSYLVTDALVVCFNVGIDTIFVSAFKDMAENKPPKFMSDSLRRGFGLPRYKDGGYEEMDDADEEEETEPALQKGSPHRKGQSGKKVAPAWEAGSDV